MKFWNVQDRKSNWTGNIFSRNCLFHDAIEGKMTEVKGVGKIRRKTQLLDDFSHRRRYWKQEEEAEDRKKDGKGSL